MKRVEVDVDEIIWLHDTSVCDVEINGHHVQFYHETFQTWDGEKYTVDLYTLGAYPTHWFTQINYALFIGSNRYL